MAIYKGQISDDFIKAEISFEVSLPKFCEDQEFKLIEKLDRGDIYWDDFYLLLNDRSAIITGENGVASYTGQINPTEVETVVIAQVKIDKDEVEQFKNRKFMLEVVS